MDLAVGRGTWALDLPAAKLVPIRPLEVPSVPTAGPRELVRAALEQPFGFEPIRRGLTPDDRVTIAFDPALPAPAELLAGVLDHLATAGIAPAAVTVVTPPGSPQGWIDDVPDEYADLTAETHDSTDERKRAYLATTKGGRRVYLNRTLVESDAVIVLTGRGYDAVLGYAGGEAGVFPVLGAADAAAGGEIGTKAPDADPVGLRAEAVEIAWLLGMPFLVQVIEGAGDTVQEVVAGFSTVPSKASVARTPAGAVPSPPAPAPSSRPCPAVPTASHSSTWQRPRRAPRGSSRRAAASPSSATPHRRSARGRRCCGRSPAPRARRSDWRS